MAVRDDGQMAVLGDEELTGLPLSGGPWQDLPLACFPMGTEKQLALAAKRLVGMARAPVGTGSAKAALLTVDQVLQVKGGLPWSAQTAAALYGRLQGCSERAMLADGALHTAKNIPKELRCHALVTALLLPVVVADLSSRHSCMGYVQEAHGKLQFV